jgi:hypothetical protein
MRQWLARLPANSRPGWTAHTGTPYRQLPNARKPFMRKLLIIAILAGLGYTYYQGELDLPLIGKREVATVISNDNPGGAISITQGTPSTFPARQSAPAVSQTQYRCDGRQHCSQMRSYDEALFFLRNCPNTKMDGDGDGIPCERQFGR